MGYNSDLDRITEAEVVPDFVERLSLGRNLYIVDSTTGFKKSTKLTEVLSIIGASALPCKVRKALLNDTKVYIMQNTVTATNGSTDFIISIHDLNASNMDLLFTITDEFRCDVSDAFTVTKNGTMLTITGNFDTPVPYGTTFTFFIG